MAKEKLKTRLKKITFVEWIVSAAGIFLFLFTLIFVLFSAIFSSNTPPDINMRILSLQQSGSDYLITVEAENRGDTSVEGLEVEVILSKNNKEVETGSTTFDYIPGNSKRKGGIFFKNNPENFKIELHPLGYEEP